MVATRLMSVDDLNELGSEAEKFELVRGELRALTPAGARHGEIAGQLYDALSDFIRPHRLGRLFISDRDYIVNRAPDSILMPDIGFVRAARIPIEGWSDGYVPFAPDLAVEVQSPSNRDGEMLEKAALYLERWATLVWIVRPLHRAVTVFEAGQPDRFLSEHSVLDGGQLLQGFGLPVTSLFASFHQRS